MVFYDSQLYKVNGLIQSFGSSFAVDVNDILYIVLSTDIGSDGEPIDTFVCYAVSKNSSTLTQISYKRNGRTMDDFYDAINLVASGNQLKKYTNMRSYRGSQLYDTDVLYDSTAIVNDMGQIESIYIDGLTNIFIGGIPTLSSINIAFDGDQIGSAPVSSSGELMSSTIELTSAQILSLHTTPIEVVPAQGAGTVICPLQAQYELKYGTTPYATNTQVSLYLGGASWISFGSILSVSQDLWSQRSIAQNASVNGANYTINQPLTITVLNGDPTAGDSTFRIKVLYTVYTQ